MKIKKCKICGKTFDAAGSKTTCSDKCARINQNNLGKKYYRKSRGLTVKKFKRNTAVRDMAAEAREHGMSYGQYVGMLYEKEIKKVGEKR